MTQNDDSSFSNASSDHASYDDVLDDESGHDHEDLESPAVQSELNSCMHYKVCTPDAYTLEFQYSLWGEIQTLKVLVEQNL